MTQLYRSHTNYILRYSFYWIVFTVQSCYKSSHRGQTNTPGANLNDNEGGLSPLKSWKNQLIFCSIWVSLISLPYKSYPYFFLVNWILKRRVERRFIGGCIKFWWGPRCHLNLHPGVTLTFLSSGFQDSNTGCLQIMPQSSSRSRILENFGPG